MIFIFANARTVGEAECWRKIVAYFLEAQCRVPGLVWKIQSQTKRVVLSNAAGETPLVE